MIVAHLTLPDHESLSDMVLIAADTFKSHNRYKAAVCEQIDKESQIDFKMPFVEKSIQDLFETHYSIKAQRIQYWINKYPPGGFQEPHTHGKGIMSFVYFVKVPENSGQLVFDKPVINQTEGSVVFFNGIDTHYVTKNLSNEERITVAGNIIL